MYHACMKIHYAWMTTPVSVNKQINANVCVYVCICACPCACSCLHPLFAMWICKQLHICAYTQSSALRRHAQIESSSICAHGPMCTTAHCVKGSVQINVIDYGIYVCTTDVLRATTRVYAYMYTVHPSCECLSTQRSTVCLVGVKVGHVHLCQVAGNTL